MIKDEKQPLLISRPKAKDIRGGRAGEIFLIPELCRATGLTDENRQNFQLMQKMATHTKMEPNTRINRLMKFRDRLEGEKVKTVFNDFLMELAPTLVQFDGRELKPEKILFGNDRSITTTSKGNWTSDLQRNKFYMAAIPKNWCVIYPTKFEATMNNFLDCFKSVAGSVNYNLPAPKRVPIPNDTKDSYLRAINAQLEQPLDFAMFLLPNTDSDRYTAVKKRCCVVKSILSQVVTAKVITPKHGKEQQLRSVALKVLVQMNAKLGGVPWNFVCPVKGMHFPLYFKRFSCMI